MPSIPVHRLGACILAAPLAVLVRRRALSLPVDSRLEQAVYGLREVVQRARVTKGLQEVPAELRPLCNLPDQLPEPNTVAAQMAKVELVVFEPNVQADIMWGDRPISRTAIIKVVTDPLRQIEPQTARPLSAWASEGLLKGNEARRTEAVAAVDALLAGRTDIDPLILEVLRGARFVDTSPEQMREYLAELRDLLGLPMLVVACNHVYTPDGRGMTWPPTFKRNLAQAAAELGLPWHDPADAMAGRDVRPLLWPSNMMNYTDEGAEFTAGPLHQAILAALGR